MKTSARQRPFTRNAVAAKFLVEIGAASLAEVGMAYAPASAFQIACEAKTQIPSCSKQRDFGHGRVRRRLQLKIDKSVGIMSQSSSRH